MAQSDEKQYIVSSDDTMISCKRPDDTTETVNWNDIESVTVEATHAGGDAAEFIWIVWGKNRNSGCVFPGLATGCTEIQEQMSKKLDGWEQKQLDEAKASKENATYIMWVKEELEDLAPKSIN